jgi:hypothetical protein
MPWEGDVWLEPGRFVQVPTADDTSPYSNPEPGPLIPGPFEVLQRGIVIAYPHGRGHQLRGDVARLSTGALVCRYSVPAIDGGSIPTVDRWHPDDNVQRVQRPRGRDWVAWARSKKQTLAAGEIGPRPDASPEDLVRFKALFPSVARRLGIDTTPLISRVFELGAISVRGDLGWQFWHDTLDRHSAAADFGTYGKLADCPESTEETMWVLASSSVVIQNAAAIKLQAGAVQSLYRVGAEHAHMLKRPDQVHGAFVTTVFARVGPITVAWVEGFHPEQHPF